MKDQQTNIFSRRQFLSAAKDALLMLTPQVQIKNPVMFVTYLGALLTIACVLVDLYTQTFSFFNFYLAVWMLLTVIFANFSQALAESHAKGHAESLRQSHKQLMAHKWRQGEVFSVPAESLRKGDVIVCRAGDIIPTDGEVIEGIATVDESAITGESAPVIRESGGDRSAVTAGTTVMTDQILIKVFSDAGKSFLDKIIQLIEGAKRQKTPNEISLQFVLSLLTVTVFLTVFSLKMFAIYSGHDAGKDLSGYLTIPILVSLFVCLIPTTVSALLSAVEIAGMDRLIRKNVIAESARAVEAASDIDLLILDKTGTITLGNRMATQFIAMDEISKEKLADAVLLASLSDETPEGRSIVVLSKNQFMLTPEVIDPKITRFFPFLAKTRMSGIDFFDENGKITRCIRKGSVDAIRKHVEALGGSYPKGLEEKIYVIAKSGGTPLLVSENEKILGVVYLKDMIKAGIKTRFNQMRKMGIRTLMVTGDNPLTAAAIAADSGVDDYIAEATPELKLEKIRKEQGEGKLVAMVGDGTDDTPALAQADVGIAMNTGTQSCREAANMVDLDSDPTKLIEIVEIAKQLLITRGVLTLFSIFSGMGKSLAILPAIFSAFYIDAKMSLGPLSAFNIMGLHSHQSAILSAVIFNALAILLLIPLALRGVRFKTKSVDGLLLRHVLIYGLGGLLSPFFFIKMIDLIVTYLPLE